MINLQTGEQTYVSRLRVRCSGLDPLAAQLRLNSLFQSAEVHPAGLAPSAIVCIRRLDDPRPRTVSLSGGNACLPPEWQQSVRASIEQLARRAPRPARETVAADSPCVVFADRAELLAALAGDWCEQRAAARWWWRSLFKETIDAAALVKLWRGTPEYVPAALEHLARRRRAVAFARALAHGEARAILETLTRRFALDELQAAVSSAPLDSSRRETTAGSEASRSEIFRRAATRENSQLSRQDFDASVAPWSDFAPEALSGDLELSQQCLLGVGLTLQRAPALARRGSFALRVLAWISAPAFGREMNAAPPDSYARETHGTGEHADDSASKPDSVSTPGAIQESGEGRASSRVPIFDGLQHPAPETRVARPDSPESQVVDASAPPPTISSHDGEPAGRNETAHVVTRDFGARSQSSEIVESAAPELEADEQDARPRAVEDVGTRIEENERDAPPASTPETEATPAATPLLEAQIETRFGGLFHLVNLALFLELYGDFTAPAAPGISLSIWDFVALLGRRMVGAEVEDDAVWPLLARLAGRTGEQQPGVDFRPPGAWRVDAGWLQKFPASGVWRWAISRDTRGQSRLQVIHPAKFLVLDVPLDGEEEAEAQLARELEIYAHASAGTPVRATRPFKLRGRTPLAQWIERVHLYARARLCLALGRGDARRAARLVCERYARVYVTATHVDILMRLAELPFEVRVAGLDRDPGWIPAAGRIVAFHFE